MAWIQLLITAFIAVLFLQSGLDKLVDRDGNTAYLRDHFQTSPLAGQAELLLTVITVFELLTGLLAGLGTLANLFWGGTSFAYAGAVLGSITILQLFFGQRLAKDYAGAAVLVPYFLLTLAAIYVLK